MNKLKLVAIALGVSGAVVAQPKKATEPILMTIKTKPVFVNEFTYV